MAPTRIAVIADIHHGADTPTKKGTAALPLLRRFVDDANAGSFDAVLDLGDRISDESPERDEVLQTEVAALFHSLAVAHHHVSGNHDHAMLSAAANERILNATTASRAVVIGEVRCVFWQPDVTLSRGRGFHLAPGDLDGLSRLLDADDRPTLLVSHVPLSGHAQTGNYYFERNPGHATYAEVAAIRAVLARAPCPMVALSGHVHWNTLTTVDGIPHVTLQSLTETFISGDAAEASGVIEIEGDALRWSVRGREPVAIELPWRRTRPRWRQPLARFGSEGG